MVDQDNRRAAGSANRLAGSLFLAQSAELATRGAQTRASLSALNTLAAQYCARDRVDEAIPLLEQAVKVCRRVLGPRDSDTLIAAGNHATAHAMLGRWDDALPLLRSNLAERVEVLGDTHRCTLDARDALAVALRLSGNLVEALATHRQVTAQRLRALGPAHPDTLTSRMGLAIAEAESGALDLAAEILADALSVASMSDAAGAEGTSPTRTDAQARLDLALRLNLALCLSSTGQRGRAAGLLAAVLADCETRFGHNHPHTVSVRHELADLRSSGAD